MLNCYQLQLDAFGKSNFLGLISAQVSFESITEFSYKVDEFYN